MTDFISKDNIVLAVCSILAVILLFGAYWYFKTKDLLLSMFIRMRFISVSKMSMEFLSEKITGILMTGVMPFVFFILMLRVDPDKIGLTFGTTGKYWYFPVFLSLITVVLSFFSSGNPVIWPKSPQLRVSKWYPRHILLSVGLWVLYLLGYEFFFRGILWFLCFGAFGFWPALLINILLYTAVHVPQGIFMTAGAAPLGIVLCSMSFLTGSFLTAFLVHVCMAVTTELSASFHNPEFQFVLAKDKSI